MAQSKYRSLMSGASMVVLGTLMAPATWAQETADQDNEVFAGFEEITITASRRSVSLQDTALSVTAINPDELSISGLTKLRDAIDFAPGVHYSAGVLPNGNTITMRGVGASGVATTVGVYVDDVPIGSSNAFAAGGSLHLDAVAGDVERMELIKGPQGTLYGSSSMGGLVRYITRDPSLGDFEGTIQADLSSMKEGGINTTFSGRISAPIVKDKIGISLSGFQEDYNGFIDRLPTSPAGEKEDGNSYERYGIYAKLAVNPTENLSAKFMFMYNDIEALGRNAVVIEGPPFVGVSGNYHTDTDANNLNDELKLYAGTLAYDFGWGTLVSSTSYQDRAGTDSADLVATFGPLVALLSGQDASEVTSAPFTGILATEKFVQEVRLTSAENQSLEWSIGGIYSDENSSNIQRLEGGPNYFLALDVDVASSVEEFALFGNATYYLSEKFDLTAGMRFAWIDSSVALTDGPGLIVANLPETTSSDTVDTYSFTARYRPNQDTSLYARIASGYRPENANLPLLDVNGNNAAPAIIATDTLWSYEVGAKGTMAERFGYDVALWYLNWSNLQATTYVNGASTGGNANSDVTAYGLELSTTASVTDHFRLMGTLGYTHSTLDDDETSAFGAVKGENMRLVPKWSGSVRGVFDYPLTDKVDGFLNAAIRYVGSKDSGFEGGVGQDGNVITPLINNFTIPDYVDVNLSAGIRIDNITASIYAKNLFNKYAFTGGSGRPLADQTVRATATVLEPRTLGVVLKVDF